MQNQRFVVITRRTSCYEGLLNSQGFYTLREAQVFADNKCDETGYDDIPKYAVVVVLDIMDTTHARNLATVAHKNLAEQTPLSTA
jgi:hypothetical protein